MVLWFYLMMRVMFDKKTEREKGVGEVAMI